MVARGWSATASTAHLTRGVLRIRQPARTRAVLIELDVKPSRGWPARSQGKASETGRDRSAAPHRPANAHASLIAAPQHAC